MICETDAGRAVVERIDLCGGDFVLESDGERTRLYPAAFLPADREGIWEPIEVPGRFRDWGAERWAQLRELAVARYGRLRPDIGEEVEGVRALLADPSASRIAGIKVRTAKEVFGGAAKDPDRAVAVIWTENGARLVLTVPLGSRYQDGRWIVFDREAFERSVGHERSRFGAFLRRYKKFPRVGMVVKTSADGRGYWTIEC
jgi:hypothetical protein